MRQWGTHAAALTDGSIAPASVKESQFVDSARGREPPQTRFQRLWLRYLQAVALEARLNEVESDGKDTANKLYATEQMVSHQDYLIQGRDNKIQDLQADVERLNKLWRFAGQKMDAMTTESTAKTQRLQLRIRDLEERFLPKESPQTAELVAPDAGAWGGWVDDWREQK